MIIRNQSVSPFRLGFLGLYLVIFLCLTSPAVAQNDVEISRDQAAVDFPETLTFQLQASSPVRLERIMLTYGTNSRSCQQSGSRQRVDFDPGLEVDVEWELELKRSGSIPPGAQVWWQWSLIDTDGNEHITERQTLTIQDDRHDWHSLSRDGLTVNWYVGDDSFGAETLATGQEHLVQVAEQIGIVPPEDIQFWVYPTATDVREALAISSEWAGAVAFPNYNIMLISLAPGEDEWAADVMPHELAHLLAGAVSFNCRGGWLPVWLNEGLSVYAEGTPNPSDLDRLESALEAERLPPLQSLSGGFSAYGGGARQAYAQSGAIVRYLIEIEGPEQMGALLEAIADGSSIDRALEQVYGFDTNGLDARWRLAQGYPATPTAVAAADENEATVTPVPTIPLVTGPVGATETATAIPPTQTARPTRASPSPTTAVPTVEPEETPVIIASDSENTEEPLQPSSTESVEESGRVSLIWPIGLGVGLLVLIVLLVFLFRARHKGV